MTRSRCGDLAAALGLAAGVFNAAASVEFSSSLPAWESATTNPMLAVTFEESSWPANQVLGGDWTLNGLTFRGNAGTIGGLGSGFFPNIYIIRPSPLTEGAITANGDEDIDVTPSPPRTALAFDIHVNSLGPVVIAVYGVSGSLLQQVEVAPGTHGFFGITSSVPIGRMNFRSVLGALENSLMDNMRLGDAHIACAADFNADGNLDPDDLGDFITCYFSQPPCDGADFNADSNIDPDDLGDFITAYFNGCG